MDDNLIRRNLVAVFIAIRSWSSLNPFNVYHSHSPKAEADRLTDLRIGSQCNNPFARVRRLCLYGNTPKERAKEQRGRNK